ncbi:hypothetical protein HPCPY6311_0909 [Helicobacter pylori CPY6311]|nr:hypothetical protein HPCPY6311_0909 [Helicobacter pylori CPY6311]
MKGFTALIGLDFNLHEIFAIVFYVRDSPNLSVNIAVF